MEIKLEDLMEPCAECKGTGRDLNRLAGSNEGYNTQPGIARERTSDGSCVVCRGQGYLKLTPSGEAVAAFVSKVFKVEKRVPI